MPLTIWSNAHLPHEAADLLARSVSPHRLVVSNAAQRSNLVAGGADPLLNDADIAFGQPDPQQVIDLPRLRWVHLNSAGYTRYDTAAIRSALEGRNAILTNSSGVYAEPCAQHALAMMLSISRHLPQCLDEQRHDRGWHSDAVRSQCYLLQDQLVLIYGFGAIGQRLAEMLSPLRMRVIGVRRSAPAATAAAGASGELRLLIPQAADALLPEADHVMNILPASMQSEEFFDADRLGKLKRSAVFYNIGRGSTVDQYALSAVLETRRIAAAYLDVTAPEPLPADSPLWRLPHCYITPHSAGGHHNEHERLVRHFVVNLQRFVQNQPLMDAVFGRSAAAG